MTTPTDTTNTTTGARRARRAAKAVIYSCKCKCFAQLSHTRQCISESVILTFSLSLCISVLLCRTKHATGASLVLPCTTPSVRDCERCQKALSIARPARRNAAKQKGKVRLRKWRSMNGVQHACIAIVEATCCAATAAQMPPTLSALDCCACQPAIGFVTSAARRAG